MYEYIDLRDRGGLRTLLGVGIGVDETQLGVYLANFVRLGIFQWHSGTVGSYESAPLELRNRIDAEFPGEDVSKFPGWAAPKHLRLTSFGRQFLEACANVKLPRTP